MLMPAKVKYRKQQKGRRRGTASRGADLSFGDYGLQALEPGWLTARQIEASRVAIQRHVKRGGKLWIRVFPDKPITKKPAETRMGKGKGATRSPPGWRSSSRPTRSASRRGSCRERSWRPCDEGRDEDRNDGRVVPRGAGGEGEGVAPGPLHPPAPEGDRTA